MLWERSQIILQLVLNWLRKDKRITTIIAGPRNISEVIDNVKSCSWSLDNEVYKETNDLIGKI